MAYPTHFILRRKSDGRYVKADRGYGDSRVCYTKAARAAHKLAREGAAVFFLEDRGLRAEDFDVVKVG